MKINNPNMKSPAVPSSSSHAIEKKNDTKAGNLAAPNSPSSEIGASAKLNVSERAQAMQKAKLIASDDSIDESKVAKFQALIDSGKYKVDAERIADRLVDEHLLNE